MKQPLLYVNDRLVDIDPATRVALTYQINEIGDLKDRRTLGTNRFTALFTYNNSDIFEYTDQVQSASSLINNRISARLVTEVDNYTGYVVVAGITEKGFDLQFLSGNAELFNIIKGKKLSDLNLTDINLPWDSLNMYDRYGAEESPTFLVVDSGELPETGRDVDVSKHYYSIYIHTLFERIITDAGFSFTGSMFQDYRYLNSFIPFTNKVPLKIDKIEDTLTWLTNEQEQIAVPITGYENLSFPKTIQDKKGQWNSSSNKFTAAMSGNISIAVNGQMNYSNPDFLVAYGYITVWINGVLVYTENLAIATGGTGTVLVNFSTSQNVYYGDEIEIKSSSYMTVPTTTAIYAAGLSVYINFNETDPTLPFGDYWNWKYNLPDLLQTDLFKTVLQLTGSIIDTDGHKKQVRIEKFESISENKNNAVVIDSYINKSPKELIDLHPDSYAQKNWLRFKKDDNVTEFFGDGSININDNTLNEEKEILKLPFAASESSVRLDGLNVATVLRIIDGNDVVPQPRILLKQIQNVFTPSGDGINLTSPTHGTVFNQDLYNGYFFDSLQDYSMSFDSIIKDNYISFLLMLNNYKKITPNFYFSPNFINQLDLFTPVFSQYFNSYFLINKITNYIPGYTCKAELIRI